MKQASFDEWAIFRCTSMHCLCTGTTSYRRPRDCSRCRLHSDGDPSPLRETFLRALAHAFLIVLITLLIVRWSMPDPSRVRRSGCAGLRTGRMPSRQDTNDLDLFRPLVREVAAFAESLNQARRRPQRKRVFGRWAISMDRRPTGVHVRKRLDNGRLFVVSNREPYMHMRRGKLVEVIVPPSAWLLRSSQYCEPVRNLDRPWQWGCRPRNGG